MRRVAGWIWGVKDGRREVNIEVPFRYALPTLLLARHQAANYFVLSSGVLRFLCIFAKCEPRGKPQQAIERQNDRKEHKERIPPMELKETATRAVGRIVKWIARTNWQGLARSIVIFLGRAIHKVLFGWLLPKRYRQLTKREIFDIIFKSDTPAGKKFDVWLLVLIVANIVLLMIDSLTGTTTTMTSGAHRTASFVVFKLLEWGFTLLFTFEDYLRIYCLKHPRKYILSFWGVIDFLSIFPAYLSLFVPATQALTVLRLLRVMRIFRIFKINRFQEEMYRLIDALRSSAVKILVFMLFVLVAAVILGTLMFSFESERNPAFNNILSGIYWAVVTITTVGYGDIAPMTAAGRFLSVLVMLLGYAIIAVPTGILAGDVAATHKNPTKRHKPHRTAAQRDYDDEQDAITH